MITIMGKKKASYTAEFKLKVIHYADKNGKRAAARKFDVDPKCVRTWCNQKEALQKAPKDKRAFRGKKCKYPEVEEALLQYVTDIRKSGYAVSTEMIQIEAVKIASRNIPAPEFKGSYD
jgi:transposase-like protein